MLLTRYILSRILIPFVTFLVVFLFALSLEKTLRIIDQISLYGAPPKESLYLIFLLLPHYASLALPLAFFVASIVAMRKLSEDSELMAIQAAGFSFKKLMKPLLILSAGVMLIELLLLSYVQPLTRYAYHVNLEELKGYTLRNLVLRPGQFQEFGEKIVIRVENISSDRSYFEKFFATVKSGDGRKTAYISAPSGFISPDPNNTKAKILRLVDGQIISIDKKDGPRVINFNEYPWRPDKDLYQDYGERGQEVREFYLSELLDGTLEKKAEFYSRVLKVVMMPVLAILAIPLSLLGFGNRIQKSPGVALGIMILVLYEKILGFGDVLARSALLPTDIVLLLPFIGLCLLTLVFCWPHIQREVLNVRKVKGVSA